MRRLDILLDCDGVLADLAQYFCEYIHSRYGVVRTPEDQKDFKFVKGWNIPQEYEDAFWADTVELDHGSRLEAYAGAREFVARLQEDHNVIACTASSNVDWTAQRAKWLQRIGIEPRDSIILGSKHKSRVLGDVIIDDRIKNCYDTACTWAILFDRPYNRHVATINGPIVDPKTHVYRGNDYASILEIIRDIATT